MSFLPTDKLGNVTTLDNSFDPDSESTIIWQEQGLEKIGTYFDELSGQMVLDTNDHAVAAYADRYEIPLGYNEGIEGIISVAIGSNVTLNIYDNNGDLYNSYSVGSAPVGFSFQSDTYTMEISPSNTDVLTEYSISLNLGQVYAPD